MIQETIVTTTSPFDGEAQTTKFWQDPKTGEVKTVPVDWEPETVIEITLTEKEIRRREEVAREEGYSQGHSAGYNKAIEESDKERKEAYTLGYNTAVEDMKDSEKKEKKTK